MLRRGHVASRPIPGDAQSSFHPRGILRELCYAADCFTLASCTWNANANILAIYDVTSRQKYP